MMTLISKRPKSIRAFNHNKNKKNSIYANDVRETLLPTFPLLDNRGEQTTTTKADNFLSDISTQTKTKINRDHDFFRVLEIVSFMLHFSLHKSQFRAKEEGRKGLTLVQALGGQEIGLF